MRGTWWRSECRRLDPSRGYWRPQPVRFPVPSDSSALPMTRRWRAAIKRRSQNIIRMHALLCPGATSTMSGSICAHTATAYRHRVRNTQPEGGVNELGISPGNPANGRLIAGSGSGAASRSAAVYRCIGRR